MTTGCTVDNRDQEHMLAVRDAEVEVLREFRAQVARLVADWRDGLITEGFVFDRLRQMTGGTK